MPGCNAMEASLNGLTLSSPISVRVLLFRESLGIFSLSMQFICDLYWHLTKYNGKKCFHWCDGHNSPVMPGGLCALFTYPSILLCLKVPVLDTWMPVESEAWEHNCCPRAHCCLLASHSVIVTQAGVFAFQITSCITDGLWRSAYCQTIKHHVELNSRCMIFFLAKINCELLWSYYN